MLGNSSQLVDLGLHGLFVWLIGKPLLSVSLDLLSCTGQIHREESSSILPVCLHLIDEWEKILHSA